MENELKQININGICNDYFIDKTGIVYSKKQKKIRILKQTTMPKGYKVATFTINKKSYNFLTHRLVAKYFIGEPKEKLTVNHKDGNKQNNNVENLEWATQLENAQHARRTGLTKGFPHSQETKNKLSEIHKKLGSGGLNAKKVINIKTNIVFDNAKIAAKEANYNYSHFSEMLTGRIKNKSDYQYV